jgi:hypothetical protein
MLITQKPLDQFPMSEEELAQVDVSLLEANLLLTPLQRLQQLEQMRQFVIALEQAGERKYGFNPSALVKTAYESC